MTPFYVLGGVLAAWALIVTALGVTRQGFPAKGGQERLVGAISVVLVAGAIGSGIVTSASEEEEHGDEPAEAAEPARGGGAELQLTADPAGDLAFDRRGLEAPAGPLTIAMENPAPVPHDVSIEGDGIDEHGEVVEQGGTSRVSAELKPGEYVFYCSVPGHREAGMEGTLTVE